MKQKNRVLIAGIGGASLGTEILKSLLLAGRYKIFGCDISQFAYGHYQQGFEHTFIVDCNNYIESVLEICRKTNIDFIIPGGEEPLVLLTTVSGLLKNEGITFVSNSPDIVRNFSDKEAAFKILAKLGFPVPITKTIRKPEDINDMVFPCVVKPARDSGGSNFVFIAANRKEAELYISYLSKNGKIPLVQEYISIDDGGEFSFGVLSLPNKILIGSIAMKRIFASKLSIYSKGTLGLVSSPYGQGLIDEFREERAFAEKIALSIGSAGPLNIQGRIKNGVFMPFEINPRFSGSVYLRAMAGFNEPDLFLQSLSYKTVKAPDRYNYGYYLRGLSEVFVKRGEIKN